MKAATLFSGIGAPEVAMPGWQWLWHAEIEKFPSAVMKARHPGSVNLGDVNAEDFVERATSVGRPDVVVWGAPCQDFSVAGKRAGMGGDRGCLALVGLRVIERLRPRWMVFENVPGLLSSYSGSAEAESEVRSAAGRGELRSVDCEEDSDFAAFLSAVRERGYLGCYRVLDAQFAGVPQRRRRVFAVFHLGDWRPAAAVLLEPESLRGNPPPGREAGQGAAAAAQARADGSGTASTLQARDHSQTDRGDGTDNLIAGTLDHASGRSRGAGTPPGLLTPDSVADPLTASDGAKTYMHEGNNFRPHNLVFGGNNTAGPIDAATAVRAKGGTGHSDFESETFVVGAMSSAGATERKHGHGWGQQDFENGYVIPVLEAGSRAGREGHEGRDGLGVGAPGDPMFSLQAKQRHAVAFEPRTRGDDGRGYDREPQFSDEVSPALNTVKSPGVIAFDTTQITHPENRSRPDDRSPQLSESGHPPAIAFSCKDSGLDAAEDVAPTLRAMAEIEANASGGGQIAVAFPIHGDAERANSSAVTPSPDAEGRVRLRDPGLGIGGEGDAMFALTAAKPHAVAFKPSHYTRDKDTGPSDVMAPLTADADKGDQDPVLFTGAAVRRLTPRECERLQAFQDDYTLIKFRGKPAADGPRYRALGNSMCVNEVRWILERIERFEGARK